MNKTSLNIGLAMTAIAFILAIFIVEKEFLSETVIESGGVSISLLVKEPAWNLLDKIEEGKKMLEFSSPLQIKERKGTRRFEKMEISLAVLDIQTGVVFEERYWLQEDEIDEANRIRRNYMENFNNLPEFVPVNPDSNYRIIVNWWNHHNSDLKIISGDDTAVARYIVVAIKILMDNDNLVYPKDRSSKDYSAIVYTPYSDFLHTEELISKGRDFLNKIVDEAFSELESLNVYSRAYPDQLIVNAYSKTFMKNLFITEQSDPSFLFLFGKRVAERVLVRLATNENKTFRYTFSKTGALGLGQIMPKTYSNIVKAYSETTLIKDEDIGRVDIVNGIKASILVIDDHFASVVRNAGESNRSRQVLAAKTEAEKEEIMAAIYNGGSGKYQAANGTISQTVRETVDFVKKFQIIRSYQLF